MTFEDSAHDHRTIRLDTRRSTLCTTLSAEDILLEILLTELQTGRHTIQYDSDEFPMGLSEYAYSEFSAEGIHILKSYLVIQ